MHHGKGRLLIISVDRNPRNSFGSYQRNDGCTMALRSASLLDCLWIAGLTVLLLNQRCTSMQNRQEIMYYAVLHASYHMQCVWVACLSPACAAIAASAGYIHDQITSRFQRAATIQRQHTPDLSNSKANELVWLHKQETWSNQNIYYVF